MAKNFSSGAYQVPNPAVVFSKSSTNPFWERRRYAAANAVSASMLSTSGFGSTNDMIRIGESLKTLGTIEQQKEMNLIKAACPDFQFSDTKDFILAFNKIMQGKKQTDEAIKRINAAIAKSKERERKALPSDKKDKRKWQDPGPHMSSLFTSYFQASLTKAINDFTYEHITDLLDNPSVFASAWDAAYVGLIDASIDEAVKKMLTANPEAGSDKEAMYGARSEWEELANLYETLPDFSAQFRGMIKSKFASSLYNLKKDLFSDNIKKNFSKGLKKTGVSTQIDAKLHLKNRRGSIGGSVYEYIQTLANMNGTITPHGTMVVGGEGVKTDMISLFDFSGSLGVDLKILNDLNKSLSVSHSLEQARKEIQSFYDRNFSKLNDNFIVYTSAKMYSLGYNFSGFHNGTTLPLSSLPTYIAEAGMSVGNAQDFLITAYNTVDGAIYEAMRGKVENQLRLVLTAAAAKLMFDDFTTIGVKNIGGSSGQAIHAFALEGVYFPSSYLFNQLGEALSAAAKDFTKWVNVKVNIGFEKAEYPQSGPDNYVKPAIIDAWNKNIASAQSMSNFSVKFLSNFKSIFGSLFS